MECMPPVFNLVLLLWRDGCKKEACELYLKERGYKSNVSKAKQGDTGGLEAEMRKARAEYKSSRDNMVDSQSPNAYQIECKALDVCMLNYIVQEYSSVEV